MEKTKFKKAVIYVTDNGYSITFSDYVGSFGESWKVAKTLDEVKKIMGSEFINLKAS